MSRLVERIGEEMKLKTSALVGPELNYAVHMAEGLHGMLTPVDYAGRWEFGGPIIEREKLALWFSEATVDEEYSPLQGPCWYCEPSFTEAIADETYRYEIGPTPLIAAMRCYVASKLGDEIEFPEV